VLPECTVETLARAVLILEQKNKRI
jgi:hypothetical protein